MAKVDISREILDWSTGQPMWQRDALRRLATQGDLSDADIADLASLCKSQHGLEDHAHGQPLDRRHLPTKAATGQPVTLTSLTHRRGVNALAPDQTIRFAENLTVVYGGNGAGKSGYTRILKSACRARGAEPILGNVISASSLTRPSATIEYRYGERRDRYDWDDSTVRETRLSRVSVFDSQCASVYTSQRTDVAYRPFGLDLFDRLAKVCEEVKKVLEREKIVLQNNVIALPDLPPDTAARNLLDHLTALTKTDCVRNLGTISEAEGQRMDELRERIRDLTTSNPRERAQALRLRADRVGKLISHLELLGIELSGDRTNDLAQTAQTLYAAKHSDISIAV